MPGYLPDSDAKFTRVCNDDNYFFSDFRYVYELVRGEFEYVQTFNGFVLADMAPQANSDKS